ALTRAPVRTSSEGRMALRGGVPSNASSPRAKSPSAAAASGGASADVGSGMAIASGSEAGSGLAEIPSCFGESSGVGGPGVGPGRVIYGTCRILVMVTEAGPDILTPLGLSRPQDNGVALGVHLDRLAG